MGYWSACEKNGSCHISLCLDTLINNSVFADNKMIKLSADQGNMDGKKVVIRRKQWVAFEPEL